jgi:ATP-dependent protease ClpP protease subunit
MPRISSSIYSDLEALHFYGLDIKNREIFLHSYLSDTEYEPGTDYRSAVYFEKNIRHLNTVSSDPILVHMHMPGGDWEDCMGIYDTIKSSKSKIVILAYAKIQSASSVILQAADHRILMPNANVLIHYGSLSLDSEHKAALSSITWSEKECNKMIDIFVDKCLKTGMAKTKNWKKMITKKHIMSQLANKSDWILNAEEAVEYGFADGIFGDKKYTNIDCIKKLK